MSKRLKICLSLWFAVLVASLCTGQTFAQEVLPPAPQPDESIGVQMSPVPSAPQEEGTELPPAAPIAVVSDSDWIIQITPALKLKSQQMISEVHALQHDGSIQHEDGHPPTMSGEQMVSEYQRIYNSIPFNRVEYDRNPTYRHDSAMEILTGNARHQTIVRHQPQQIVRQAAQRPRMNPYQFGYLRPALRLNYYRYFPSLNPYLNAYNLSGAF